MTIDETVAAEGILTTALPLAIHLCFNNSFLPLVFYLAPHTDFL